MKTIIFDLDGTILDTLPDLKTAVNFALAQYELPPVSLEYVRKAVGNGTQMLVRRCIPKGTPETLYNEIFETFRVYYAAHAFEETKPYPGIKEVLIRLKADHQLAVISNKDNDLAKRIITRFFPYLFDIVQGSYLDQPKKPHPYLIEKVLRENNIKREECLFIGDSEVDKETATNANIKFKLVNYGYRTKEELLNTCPKDTSIDSIPALFAEIIEWKN